MQEVFNKYINYLEAERAERLQRRGEAEALIS